jgi:hypothetical protein
MELLRGELDRPEGHQPLDDQNALEMLKVILLRT